MAEMAGICAASVIMAAIYSGTAHPKLYAFFGILSGAVSLIASEVYFTGTAAGITPYSAAMSVILGVPGTALHYFLGII